MSFRRSRSIAVAVVCLFAAPDAGRALTLEVPAACRIGVDCFIQNFVDVAPGPERRDYACGDLTYDGHKGTDFRIADLAAMRRGVTVVAAAAGVVARVRDEIDDAGRGAAEAGREAGNAVVIDHGDGWETQYSHLRRGSVVVAPGRRVTAGTPLGMIGLSGATEFPHVDFTVRRHGRVFDPFVGDGAAVDCSGSRRPLWSASAAAALTYRPSAVLSAGFALEQPDAGRARDGAYAETVFDAGAERLAFWADVMGGRAGDRLSVVIDGPDGRPLHRGEGVLSKNFAVFLAAGAAARPPAGWPAGTYRAQVVVRRGAVVAVEATREIRR